MITLVLTLIYFVAGILFWSQLYQGHIYYWEYSNFFVTNSDFIMPYLLRVGGFGELMSMYILQFFSYPWIAAFLLTLIPYAVFQIILAVRAKRTVVEYTLASVSAIVVFAIMLSKDVPFNIVFVASAMAAIALGVSRIPNRIAYLVLASIFSVIAYWSGGPWAFILYVSVLALAYILHNVKSTTFQTRSNIAMAVLALWAVVVVYQDFNKEENLHNEHMFVIERYAEHSEWDKIVNTLSAQKEMSIEEQYLLALALNCKGDMGNSFFNYPFLGEAIMAFEKQQGYKLSLYKGIQYRSLGLINSSIHQYFQASVLSKYPMDFRTLRALAALNVEAGESRVANKYISILEQSTLNGDLCANLKKQLANPQPVTLPKDFFMECRPFVSDLARVADVDITNKRAYDYVLTTLLLRKELGKFCTILNNSPYATATQPLPQHYQEAIIIAQLNNIQGTDKFAVSAQTSQKFKDFNGLFKQMDSKKGLGKELVKDYANTWWHYFQFGVNAKAAL
ncbi:MAG: DUF6057 family protein [Marinifilaceae bacterium]